MKRKKLIKVAGSIAAVLVFLALTVKPVQVTQCTQEEFSVGPLFHVNSFIERRRSEGWILTDRVFNTQSKATILTFQKDCKTVTRLAWR